MLFLLRKIRRKLLTENKVTTYVLYAVGEIFLVVIGILIAVSIDDWNENKKLETLELNTLQEIKSNLQQTLHNFSDDTAFNNQTIRNYRLIETYVLEDKAYDSDLDTAIASITLFSSPFAVSSAYVSLQNRGMELIKNSTLRSRIQLFYDAELTSLQVDVDKSEWSLNDNVVDAYFSKNFRYVNNGSLFAAKPNDFELLKRDPEFLNILSWLIRTRLKGIKYYMNTMASIQLLIQEIDAELLARN
jgi:mRNA-degrading endonuclease HigB of HigAB toxin-antitoxin module